MFAIKAFSKSGPRVRNFISTFSGMPTSRAILGVPGNAGKEEVARAFFEAF